ncbi:MAG: zinc ribbon domain-containing protein [Lachnospiraceae bacterium]|nr:zinc ribbon domain-containing protein [Lachnospiraceae bacterium]
MSEIKISFCHECGSKLSEGARFCSECGAPLYGSKPINSDSKKSEAASQQGITILNGYPHHAYIPPATGGMMCPDPVPTEKTGDNATTPKSIGDLKLLVDCCTKALSTAAGDGHNETVLYLNEKTGEYQIHTFSQEVGVLNETHHAFSTDEKTYFAVIGKIEETGIEEYENKTGAPLAGGEYVCKYSKGNRFIRITTSCLPDEKHKDLHEIHAFLNSYIDKTKEIPV